MFHEKVLEKVTKEVIRVALSMASGRGPTSALAAAAVAAAAAAAAAKEVEASSK